MQSTRLPPFQKGTLPLDDIHTMYWEQTGNPHGQPVVLLHGGPGAGIDFSSMSHFDTRHYRVISYDQRGSGQSTPAGCLFNNTTAHLVDDLEHLRQHLHIENWIVSGGSWGSALALAYAQHYPNRVNGLILRGIFLCQQCEIDWYFNGIQHFFPDAWRDFNEYLPLEKRDHAACAYYQLILNPDPKVHVPAARQWCLYESRCATLLPDPLLSRTIDDQQCHTIATIQTHYFRHGFFVNEVPLLNRVEKIKMIPTEIIQGRYDMICPPVSAYHLQQLLPEAHLRVIANAGHSTTEPGIRRALLDASEKFKFLNHLDTTKDTDHESTV